MPALSHLFDPGNSDSSHLGTVFYFVTRALRLKFSGQGLSTLLSVFNVLSGVTPGGR